MTTAAAIAAKVGSAVLSSEKGRKAVGGVLVAVLSPLIVTVALLCGLGSGSAEHNGTAVKACFYGGSFTAEVPVEYQTHIRNMQSAFATLDAATANVNAQAESNSLDPIRVKAVFYALCFGESAPTGRAANNFVGCFYTTETRSEIVEAYDSELDEIVDVVEEYTVTIPLPLETVYTNLATLLGREITADDRDNADHIYTMIAGSVSAGVPGGNYGSYERGVGGSTDFDGLVLSDSATKNAADLVAYAEYAWANGWGYVWGTIGGVLTQSLLDSKTAQYPVGVGDKYATIQSLWLGRRTADCVGLIKSYGWYDPDAREVKYGTNGMPDCGANQMYYAATESGTIDTIPEIPGLAVWRDGHIGVYIGNGEVIEAMGTNYGVVKTKLADRSFTHWLKVPYINYN